MYELVLIVLGTLAGSLVTLLSRRWRDDERTAAEHRLRASENDLRLTFEAAPIGMALVDTDGRFLRVNPALSAIVGYPSEALIGTSFQSITHPDDLEVGIEEMHDCLAGSIEGFEIEKRYLRGDDREVWAQVNGALARDDAGAPQHFVVQIVDITERRDAAAALAEAKARLAHQATHDPLTGLPNRALLEDRVMQARAVARRHGELLAALYIDIDHFKAVNDTHGHAIGDLLLTEVAARLRAAARVDDTVARLGGDEFVVIAGVADVGAAEVLAERLCAAFDAPFRLRDLVLDVSASIGVATNAGGSHGLDPLEAADLALYEAKATGRARWVAYRDELAERTAAITTGRGDEGASNGATAAIAEQLRVSARYRAHVAESMQALVVHDQGKIVAVSPPTMQLLGTDDAQFVIGRHLYEFVTPESLANAQARQAMIDGGGWPQPDVFEITTPRGRLAVEITSTPVLWNGAFASQLTLRPLASVATRRSS